MQMARVAAYLRRSSPGEDETNTSLGSQLEDVVAWVVRDGHRLVLTFSDPGGKSYTLNRPVFQQMMDAARRGEFDILAVWRFDRLSRIQEQSIIAISMLKRYGVQVISVTQPLPDGPVGAILLSSYQLGSELELEGIRQRTYRGKLRRVKSGKLPGMAYPKYGYGFAGNKKERFVLNTDTAPVVKRIYEEYVGGKTLRAICASLISDGIPNPSQALLQQGYKLGPQHLGARWRANILYKILTDTAYFGKMIGFRYKQVYVNRTHPVSGEIVQIKRMVQRDRLDENRVEYGPEVCPPIISEAMFRAAQERLKENRERSSRNTKHPHDLLLRAGIGRCGYCNHWLLAKYSNKDQQHRYTCGSHNKGRDGVCPAPTHFSVRAKELDDLAWDWFIAQLSDRELIQPAFNSYMKDHALVRDMQNVWVEATRQALAEAREREESYLKAVGGARTDTMRNQFIGLAEGAHELVESLSEELETLEDTRAEQQQDEAMLRMLLEMEPKEVKKLKDASMEVKREALYRCKVIVYLWDKDRDGGWWEPTWLEGLAPTDHR
jgi:site-specific DNA recombinase